MKTKTFNVYAFKILQSVHDGEFNHSEHLKGEKLVQLLNKIRELPVDLSKDKESRYTNIGSAEEKCLIFYDQFENAVSVSENLIPAFFLKRRGGSRPFEEDGHGKLIELKLSSEVNELAEVGYLLFLVNEGFLLWIYNPFVGGFNKFTEYTNEILIRANTLNGNRLEFSQYGLPSVFELAYIIYPNALSDFKTKILDITGLEFNFASTRESLMQAFLLDNRDITGIELIKHFVNSSNCGHLGINIHSEKQKKKDRILPDGGTSLNKRFIVDLYDQTIPYLQSSKKSKFIVHAKTIDEDYRVIDLINSKLLYSINLEYDSLSPPINIIVKELIQIANRKAAEMKEFTK